MSHEDRILKLNRLLLEQNKYLGPAAISAQLLPATESSEILLPIFDEEIYRGIANITSLESMPTFDTSIFAKWHMSDIPIMIIAGGLGTLSSVALKDFFADLHDDDWARHTTSEGGHSGENVDWVPGNKQPGGFGHRWQFGHDVLNPFEVDWEQYSSIAKKGGGILPTWLKAPFYWLRHLFQDTFSTEGLPSPGNSLLHLLPHFDPSNKTSRELLQILGTIKMRDIAGAGVTNLVMGGYLWGTEKDIKRVFTTPNYRAFSLMLGANLITLLSGLLVPPPRTSLNFATIPVIGYYSYQLIKMEKFVRAEITKRDAVLSRNDQVISRNDLALKHFESMNDEYFSAFLLYEDQVSQFVTDTMTRHRKISAIVR